MPCTLNDGEVRKVIERLGDSFTTLDFVAACPRSGGTESGRACPVVARERRSACGSRLGLFRCANQDFMVQVNPGASPARWQRGGEAAVMVAKAAPTGVRHASGLVRPGHYRALDYMASADFLDVKTLFERYPEIGGVYFRPTDGYVTTIDLHPQSLKPRIGVGEDPYLPIGARARDLEPTMSQRIEWLRQVRSRQTAPSREVQFEAHLIREAQANHLRLPGFPDRLRFLHSQWRIDPTASGTARITDLLAVDLRTRRLVVIELKASPDAGALSQAGSYVHWFGDNADVLNPFFLRLARVMGRLYDCPEMERLDALGAPAAGLGAWPSGGASGIEVVGLKNLDLEVPFAGTEAASENRPGEGQHAGSRTSISSRASAQVEVGPQYAGDPPFRARMRLAQSRYRAQVLGVPCGTGPNPHDTRALGNMLRPEDGDRGLNFLTPEIHAIARRRAHENGRNVKPFRLFNNLLSSQPMCFNLFGPLVDDLELATRLFQVLLPDQVQRVTRVQIEEAPEPVSEYLADNTSFDAFVEYRRTGGGHGFVGIETKLTEPFSARAYDRPEYRRWMASPRAPWRPDANGSVADVAHNQLWRDHLLAIALRDHPNSRFTDGQLLLVHHPDDDECSRAAAGYRALLQPGDRTFRDIHLDDLVHLWARVLVGGAERAWLDGFRRRYLSGV